MKGAPWFKFFPADFMGGVVELSSEERGSYITLLCAQWQTGSLPPELDRLERIAGGRVSPSVLGKFIAGEDGRLRNARLESHREEATAKSRKATDAAAKRWDNERTYASDADAMRTHSGRNADGHANAHAETRGQSLESRVHIPQVTDTPQTPQGPSPEIPAPVRVSRKPKRTKQDEEDVSRLYAIIPKKEAYEAAVNQYAKTKNKPPIEELERILRAQVAEKGEDWTKERARYCIRLSVWIKEFRWKDQLSSPPQLSFEDHQRLAEEFQRKQIEANA